MRPNWQLIDVGWAMTQADFPEGRQVDGETYVQFILAHEQAWHIPVDGGGKWLEADATGHLRVISMHDLLGNYWIL